MDEWIDDYGYYFSEQLVDTANTRYIHLPSSRFLRMIDQAAVPPVMFIRCQWCRQRQEDHGVCVYCGGPT